MHHGWCGIEYGIRVIALCPGSVINTNLLPHKLTTKDLALLIRRIPLRKPARPIDIAKLVYFLANDDSHITGTYIVIDGGESMIMY